MKKLSLVLVAAVICATAIVHGGGSQPRASASGRIGTIGFNHSPGPAFMTGNISSVTKLGIGEFLITFTNAEPDTSYVVSGSHNEVSNATWRVDAKLTTGFKVLMWGDTAFNAPVDAGLDLLVTR